MADDGKKLAFVDAERNVFQDFRNDTATLEGFGNMIDFEIIAHGSACCRSAGYELAKRCDQAVKREAGEADVEQGHNNVG